MTIKDIVDSVIEQDTYRRDEEIKRRIYEWSVSKLPPCDADKQRTITGVNYETGEATFIDRLTADIEAERQATESTRKATPIIYDQPIETPFVTVTSQSGGKGIGITATDEGVLVPFIVHESPWPAPDVLKAKIKAAVEKKNAHHAAGKDGVNGQLQKRIENIERALGWRE